MIQHSWESHRTRRKTRGWLPGLAMFDDTVAGTLSFFVPELAILKFQVRFQWYNYSDVIHHWWEILGFIFSLPMGPSLKSHTKGRAFAIWDLLGILAGQTPPGLVDISGNLGDPQQDPFWLQGGNPMCCMSLREAEGSGWALAVFSVKGRPWASWGYGCAASFRVQGAPCSGWSPLGPYFGWAALKFTFPDWRWANWSRNPMIKGY